MATITKLLSRHFKKAPKAATVETQATLPPVTEAELAADTTEMAVQLARLNVGQEDRVLICLENDSAKTAVEKAVWRIGGRTRSLPGHATADDVKAALQKEPITAMLVRDDLIGTVKAERSTVTRLVALNTAPGLTLIRDRALVGHLPKTTA
ncbi:AMP-binding protein [Lactiplantibacillus daowaiensis]|uniref:AMP-binding protein n=1 Tax=Lactiplantibacillus daowaiensis TaxID=2559918 RepID=A0ABW1S1H5_9LACO|nr:AMP-binding protein [Lactiplantibacillus daowaiensis]